MENGLESGLPLAAGPASCGATAVLPVAVTSRATAGRIAPCRSVCAGGRAFSRAREPCSAACPRPVVASTKIPVRTTLIACMALLPCCEAWASDRKFEVGAAPVTPHAKNGITTVIWIAVRGHARRPGHSTDSRAIRPGRPLVERQIRGSAERERRRGPTGRSEEKDLRPHPLCEYAGWMLG